MYKYSQKYIHNRIINYTPMHIHTHAYPHPCISTPMHIHTHAYPHPCIPTPMHISTPMHIHPHAYPHPCISTPMNIHTHAHPHPCISTPMHIHTHAYPHPCISTHPYSVVFLLRVQGMMKRANYADCQTHKAMHDEFVMKMKAMHCPVSAADMHYMKEWWGIHCFIGENRIIIVGTRRKFWKFNKWLANSTDAS